MLFRKHNQPVAKKSPKCQKAHPALMSTINSWLPLTTFSLQQNGSFRNKRIVTIALRIASRTRYAKSPKFMPNYRFRTILIPYTTKAVFFWLILTDRNLQATSDFSCPEVGAINPLFFDLTRFCLPGPYQILFHRILFFALLRFQRFFYLILILLSAFRHDVLDDQFRCLLLQEM